MKETKTKKKWGLLLLAIPIVVLIVILAIWRLPKKQYEAKDFQIPVLKSQTDKDQDGIDDYTEDRKSVV